MKIKFVKIIFAGVFVFFGLVATTSLVKAKKVSKGVSEQAVISKTAKVGSNNQFLVTFVELGSVNCIPCKMMQPVLAEIEKEYGKQVKVIFHDVWTPEGRPFGKQYQIRAIPTQVFLDKNGKEYFRHMGFFPKEEIVKVLKKQGVK
jgi:thioredoxin 1